MQGRTAIVTGGFGALGRAVAALFAARGARGACVDHAPAPDEPFPGLDIGGMDLADPATAAGVIARVSEALGPPTFLLNIAGGFAWTTLDDGGPAAWEAMFRANSLTAVTMTKAALPALIASPGAAIVNIGAAAAASAASGMGAYAAWKSAVARLTESLAAELARHDVTVNAVLPSIIDTPGNRASMPGADRSAWVTPEAIARVIAFLCSADARTISGAAIPVKRGSN